MPDTYVNDYTGKLDKDEIRGLNEQIYQLEKTTTVQMAVLLIDHLPKGMEIEDYAREVGNGWKVGNHQNGIVYVAVLEERKHRLEIARNLEGDIPDITAGTMIDNMKPYLIQQEYYKGLSFLISEIQNHLAPVNTQTDSSGYTTPEVLPEDIYTIWQHYADSTIAADRKEFERKKAYYDRIGNIVLIIILIGVILFCIWAWKYKKKYVRDNTVNGVYIGAGSDYYASHYGSSDSSGSGGGGFGGFGGGGGGGFSGGGASGSW